MDKSIDFSDPQETDLDVSIKRLIYILKSHNPILMVGAGSSRIIGYPDWPKLINELNKLTPSLQRDKKEDLLTYASRIKDYLIKEGRIDEYYDLLRETFQPKTKHFDMFHRSLLNLGFTGVVTTNYDIVLELAASSYGLWCEPIDLCSLEEKYIIFKYLRSISRDEPIKFILHLHGCFKNPKKIVLTQEDYLSAYGEIIDEKKLKYGQALHTFHRKVIWSLLAAHPIVFIGFSMSDDFFIKMLEIVKEDFDLDTEPMHFAIMSDNDKERKSEFLKSKGVFPLFYPQSDDHRGLQDLIFRVEHLREKKLISFIENQAENKEELSDSGKLLQVVKTSEEPGWSGISSSSNAVSQSDSPNLDEINKKMLEL